MAGDLDEGFGRAIRARRDKLGLTQEKVADLADLTPRYMSQLERGLQSPTLRAIASLAKALDCRPRDLIADAEGLSERR